jgi:antitoxin (DNA-binding transcriptional repressor) of toxin-antitoxin stability system
MEKRISATELARQLGDILGRIRYQGESYTVERNGRAVARLTPVLAPHLGTAAEAFTAWKDALDVDRRWPTTSSAYGPHTVVPGIRGPRNRYERRRCGRAGGG